MTFNLATGEAHEAEVVPEEQPIFHPAMGFGAP